MWAYVATHFDSFRRNVELQPQEHIDALGKAERVARCLHNAYYDEDFNFSRFLLSGSYAKGTAIRPSSDVDMMFQLTDETFLQYSGYASGAQSALLQNVRGELLKTFPRTDIKADGQAIIVDYESRVFEVVPTFLYQGQFYIADTSNGGRWKPTNPIQEAQELHQVDAQANGHVRALIKYLKVWKRFKDVPLKSIVLEKAALYFVQQWPHLQKSLSYPVYWHDWLVRDFFVFILQYNRLNMPFNEVIYFGDGWQRKVEEARNEAIQACYFEQHDCRDMAASHWKNIFGSQFPDQENIALRGLSSMSLLQGL